MIAVDDYKNLNENKDNIKGEFLENMSHEIRTPLNAIIGFSEILYSQISDIRQKNYIKAINTAGSDLLNLINDILDLSKIEAGLIELKLEPINPLNIIKEINQIFSLNIANKNLDFFINANEDIPEFLLLDEILLRQVLLKIVENAVKFTDKGYIRISIKKYLPDAQDTNIIDLIIEVEDTGIGIPKDNFKRIFEPFRQLRGHDTKYEWTGLGLSICDGLIKIMNGEVLVESKVGVGSKFTITLHGVNISLANSDLYIISKSISSENLEKKKMPISDEVQINRELLKEMTVCNKKNMDYYNMGTDIYDMKLPVEVEGEFIDEVLPLVDKLKVGIKGNIANELSTLLVGIGNNYDIEDIINMGKLFNEAVECFDIIKINEYLKMLETWIIIIKQRKV